MGYIFDRKNLIVKDLGGVLLGLYCVAFRGLFFGGILENCVFGVLEILKI
jgi:hypothetical protein